MWLGLDDTDSLDGGCTTYTFYKLLKDLPCEYKEPRLTRLWPFAARRTRGNAALSVELDCDDSIVDWLDEYWNKHIVPLKGKTGESQHSTRKQYPSDPGMVLFKEQPDETHYWNAVRKEATYIEGGHQWGGNGRIGAAASCAWKGDNATWEGIGWSKEKTEISELALTQVESIEGTFLCRDPRTKRGLLSPRGNSPVAFGVRATSKSVAEEATKIIIDGHPNIDSHLIFKTNQATGDHIENTGICKIEDVSKLKGGHVIINDKLLCFADSGKMNTLCQSLEIGDEIEYLGLEFENKTHLEAIKIVNATEKTRPICNCGTRMKSLGKGQGSRCPRCKSKTDTKFIYSKRENMPQGWVQPPYDKRRHLAKDLSGDHKC